MKLQNLLFSSVFLFSVSLLIHSCGSSVYMARYDVKLSSVETPTDIKQPYGESRITQISEEANDGKICFY